VRTHPRWLLVVVVLVLVALAAANRFIQDDAFISLRYAKHLVEGKGLVWNEGERVEGYTNPLWVLIMALPLVLGWEPVRFLHGVGLACFAGTLVLTHRLARALELSPPAALVAVTALGTNYTFSAYATGGLETQLQALLFTAAMAMICGWPARSSRPAHGGLAVLSVILALALLTRPDSAILVAIAAPVAAALVLRDREPGTLRHLLALGLPFAVLVGGWLAWKLSYYGALLPNTYYAKTGARISVIRGLVYVDQFVRSYWLAPALIVPLVTSPRLVRARGRGPAGVLAGLGLLWSAYVVSVGGDFMEFRFVVPVLPSAAAGLTWAACAGLRSRGLRGALLAVTLAGPVHHVATFSTRRGIETITKLEGHLVRARENWIGIGQTLGAALRGSPEVTIAITAAGAVPYYSGLRAVDMYGLNDPWVARHGVILGSRPGHQRAAPLGYLRERGVHLVLGHPQMVGPAARVPAEFSVARLEPFTIVPVRDYDLPENARVLEIPIGAGYRLLALYLEPHAAIDRAIARHDWRVRPVRRS
jgi:hypothetical protein